MAKSTNNKKSKIALAVTLIAIVAAVIALIIPSLYIPQDGKLVMGFSTTFGGAINFQGATKFIGFPVALFIGWLLIIAAGALAFFFGSNQKSTYFFVLCLFIASGIIYALTLNTVLEINVAGGIAGFHSAELCAQPYMMITLCAFGAIGSITGMVYKPSKRRY